MILIDRRSGIGPRAVVARRRLALRSLTGALRALGDHIEPGTDTARILEELGGDLDSVDQLH